MDAAVAIATEFVKVYGAKLVSNRAELVGFYVRGQRRTGAHGAAHRLTRARVRPDGGVADVV